MKSKIVEQEIKDLREMPIAESPVIEEMKKAAAEYSRQRDDMLFAAVLDHLAEEIKADKDALRTIGTYLLSQRLEKEGVGGGIRIPRYTDYLGEMQKCCRRTIAYLKDRSPLVRQSEMMQSDKEDYKSTYYVNTWIEGWYTEDELREMGEIE